MEAGEKQNSTTSQVQQDIEHFKEQYLHSLGITLSRGSSLATSSFLSPASSSAFLRRDSLSSVGTRRDSLSSSSSQEDIVSSSSSGPREEGFTGVLSRREAFSSSSTRLSKQRVISDQTQSAGATPTGKTNVCDLEQLKAEYIQSLGLLHRPLKSKSLPRLKDRVTEFETLMAKSASHAPKVDSLTDFNSSGSHQMTPYTSSVEQHLHNSQETSKPSFAKCKSPPTDVDNGDTSVKYSDRSIKKVNSQQSSLHSQNETASLSTKNQRNIPTSSDNSTANLLRGDQSSPNLQFPILSSPQSLFLSPAAGIARDPFCVPNKRHKMERTLSLDSRTEALQQPSKKASFCDSAKKLTDFTVERPVIHKAYTEKEKSFILESFRKSGGKQQRALSLGSSMSMQTDNSDSLTQPPQAPRLPWDLSHSVSNIVSRFEGISHCQLKDKAGPAYPNSTTMTSEGPEKRTPFVQGMSGGLEWQLVKALTPGEDVTPRQQFDTTGEEDVTPCQQFDTTGEDVTPRQQFDTTREDVTPCQQFDTTGEEDVTPCQQFDTTDIEDVTPCQQFDTTDIEDVTPCQQFDTTDIEDVTPCQQFDTTGEDVTPRQQFNTTDIEDVTPRQQFETTGEDVTPRQQFDTTGEDVTPRQQFDTTGEDVTPRQQFDTTGEDVTPRQQFDTTDKEDVTPRQQFDTTGEEDVTPRQQFDTTGEDVTPRQQFDTTDKEDVTPRQQFDTTGEEDVTPRQQFDTTDIEDVTPRQQFDTTREENVTPRQQFDTTDIEDVTPRQQFDTTGEEDVTPCQQFDTTREEDVTPRQQFDTTVIEDVTPRQQFDTTGEEDVTPCQQFDTTGEEDVTQCQQFDTTGEEDVTPRQQFDTTDIEDVTPRQQFDTTREEDVTPRQQFDTTDIEDVTPRQQFDTTGEEDVTPCQQFDTTREEDVTPRQQFDTTVIEDVTQCQQFDTTGEEDVTPCQKFDTTRIARRDLPSADAGSQQSYLTGVETLDRVSLGAAVSTERSDQGDIWPDKSDALWGEDTRIAIRHGTEDTRIAIRHGTEDSAHTWSAGSHSSVLEASHLHKTREYSPKSNVGANYFGQSPCSRNVCRNNRTDSQMCDCRDSSLSVSVTDDGCRDSSLSVSVTDDGCRDGSLSVSVTDDGCRDGSLSVSVTDDGCRDGSLSVSVTDDGCRDGSLSVSVTDDGCRDGSLSVSVTDDGCRDSSLSVSVTDDGCRDSSLSVSVADDGCRDSSLSVSVADDGCRDSSLSVSVADDGCRDGSLYVSVADDGCIDSSLSVSVADDGCRDGSLSVSVADDGCREQSASVDNSRLAEAAKMGSSFTRIDHQVLGEPPGLLGRWSDVICGDARSVVLCTGNSHSIRTCALIDDVNRSPESIVRNRPGETCSRQSRVLLTCARDRSEEVNDVYSASIDGGNKVSNINSGSAHIEQMANTEEYLDDRFNDEHDDWRIQRSTSTEKSVFNGTAIAESVSYGEVCNPTVDEQQVLSVHLDTDEPTNSVCSKLQDISSVVALGTAAREHSETNMDVCGAVQCVICARLKSVGTEVSSSRHSGHAGSYPCWDISPHILWTSCTENSEPCPGETCPTNATSRDDNLHGITGSDLVGGVGGKHVVACVARNFMEDSVEITTSEAMATLAEDAKIVTGDRLVSLYMEDHCMSGQSGAAEDKLSSACSKGVASPSHVRDCSQQEGYSQARGHEEAGKELLSDDISGEVLTSSINSYLDALIDGAFRECTSVFRFSSRNVEKVLARSELAGSEICFLATAEPSDAPQVGTLQTALRDEGKHCHGVLPNVGVDNLDYYNHFEAVEEAKSQSFGSQHVKDNNNNSCVSLWVSSISQATKPVSLHTAGAESGFSVSRELQDSMDGSSERLGGGPQHDNILKEVSVLCTEANLTDESVITSQANLTDENVITSEAKLIDESVITSQANLTDENVITSQANLIDESVITSQANLIDESVITSEANLIDESVITSQANLIDESVITSQANLIDESVITTEANLTEDSITTEANLTDDSITTDSSQTEDGTETEDSLPVPESGVQFEGGSCSDISENVDSFYSGVSEMAESFHSADDRDVFEEVSKGTCRFIVNYLSSSGEICSTTQQCGDGRDDDNAGKQLEPRQAQTSHENVLGVSLANSDPSDIHVHESDLRDVIPNIGLSLKAQCDYFTPSRDCHGDFVVPPARPTSSGQHEKLLMGTATSEHTSTNQQNKNCSEYFVNGDEDHTVVTDHFSEAFSDMSAFSTECTSASPDEVDILEENDEEIKQTEHVKPGGSSRWTGDDPHAVDHNNDFGFRQEVESDVHFVDDCWVSFRRGMIVDHQREKDVVYVAKGEGMINLFEDIHSQDLHDQASDGFLTNIHEICNSRHCELSFEASFCQNANSLTNNSTTISSLPENSSSVCQSNLCLDRCVITKQSSDSQSEITCDSYCDGTAVQLAECCDRHVSILSAGQRDEDTLKYATDYVVAEKGADTQLAPDRSYDSNTESCDDGPESMDRDSLEDDVDTSMVDCVDVAVDSERPTTTSAPTNNSNLLSASSQQPASIVFPHSLQSQDESPPMCTSLFVPKDETGLTGALTLTSSSLGHPNVVPTTHPMTLGQNRNTLGLQGQQSKIKEKRWKEAEDAAVASKANPSIRSPRKINAPIHLDLASTSMAEAAQDEILDSPSSVLHRIPSTGAFQPTQTNGGRLDPYRLLERSQSDASLLKRDLEIMATDDDIHLTAAESSSGQNISECNRVYMDLSRAEAFERVELGETAGVMMRTSSGRLLETIPQDEELKTGDLSYVYASHRSFSQDSSSSMEDLTFSPKNKSKDSAKYKSCGKIGQDNSITSSKSNLRSSFQIYSHSLKQKVRQLQMGSVPEQLNAITELNVLMEQAWSMPIYGKDLAYELCDILRTESALDIIVSNLASNNRELMKVSARLLEQSLTTSNRRQVSDNGLELVVKMTHDARGDCELAQICTGILESLFKTSEDTCARVIKMGGLDTITYWCRCNDRVTLKNCAIALSNLALYGGGENQQEMAKHKVPEWLFPLAFVEDDSVRYYALLAIGVLVSNKEIESAVTSSGTLALVLPFIDNHDPAEFAERDTSHRHGRSPGWLKRLIPVLSSKREEAQALAAFHFVMEAGIKSEQGRKEVLYKIGAVDPLKWLASTPNRVASKLAAQALKIIGEEIPHKLSLQAPLWTCDDVVHWIAQVGFGTYADKFKSCHIDGDLLLRLTEEELRDSLNMICALTRKRFLRELRDLKISSDYTSCDPSMLGAWLQDVGEDMSQYTYQMLNQGVDRPLLRALNDSLLVNDCRIVNGIHRMKILSKIEELRSSVSSPSCPRFDSIDCMTSSHNPPRTPIDVFISYRRSNGSQLASLLKVHLQLRGFTVFIDIEKLKAGKFDESLLESVRQAKNFIIVLTQSSLDRCMGDDEKKDWVHREITAAIEAGSNIIPLLDNFRWPSPESLPEDMRSICYFNAVRWIHDYQDACVDKLEKFLRGETNPQQRHPVSTTSTTANNNTGAAPPSPKQTSCFESPNSPPYQRAQGMRKMNSVESPVDSS